MTKETPKRNYKGNQNKNKRNPKIDKKRTLKQIKRTLTAKHVSGRKPPDYQKTMQRA